MRRILICAACFACVAFFAGKVSAQEGIAPAHTELAQDALVAKGFQHFYNLEFDQALQAFQTEAKEHPRSPDAYNHVAQTILYREMFRSGALESELVTGRNPFFRREKMNPGPADEKEFRDSIGRAMTLAQARIMTHPNDVAAHYSLGVSYGLRSNYGFLVRKAYLDSLRDASGSRSEHKRVTELDPAFVDAQLVQGVYDYLVGSLSWTWKMLGFIAGYRGDRERGIETLQMVAEKGSLNRSDAKVALCAIYRRERNPEKAIPLLKGLVQEYPRNYLFRLELVQMYGDAGDKDNGLAVIDELDRLKHAGGPGYDRLPEEKIRYTRGTLLFWYDDLDRALEDMKAVTAKADTLDLNTGVYAWLRLGQIYDLQGKRGAAVMAYNRTIGFDPNSDAADEAKKYARSPYKQQ